MCGLAGFVDHQLSSDQYCLVAETMACTIAHRGPDDSGVWVDHEAGIALAHRRLSIIDVSAAGHQPMVSASGRFLIVFNGEIYNYGDLRAELGHQSWRGHSDTETLLAGIECWGLVSTLKRSRGMFAFALWDRLTRELKLGRDRMGEKPLYYGWQGSAFLFASELKALRAHPKFRREIDGAVLPLYLRHLSVPAPYSIYRGIRKLVPGTVVTISSGTSAGTLPDPVPYWSLRDAVAEGKRRPFHGDDTDALAELETRLREAVNLQRIADVPLGAFLSGGIDSSLVVAMMQMQSSRPVKTFTIGFHESRYNEAHHANAVARHLGTDHSELYVTSRETLDVIPKLPQLYDEPFADSSQISTYLVSKLARQRVTVSLSGDGGDELFGGYGRYFSTGRVWRKLRLWPSRGRWLLARSLRLLSPEVVGHLLDPILLLHDRRFRQSYADRLQALAGALECDRPEQFYALMTSQWREPLMICKDGNEPAPTLVDSEGLPSLHAYEERVMYADAVSYLPDDILVKIDRAAMAVSLETRIPLLDHRVVEFAWCLPLRFKMRNGQGKWLLRQLLHKSVPAPLASRAKHGFGVPVDDWLRGPLREWAEDLLKEERLNQDGFFQSKPIRQRWHDHLSGRCNWRDSLWTILMFQDWLKADSSGRSQN